MKNVFFRMCISACIFGLVLSGCSTTGKHYVKKPATAFPMEIGVLADSQITSRKGSFDYGMRKKAADLVTNVAIRPAAIEYLSPEMLKYFLIELEKEKVDLILYLGDGANSGCKDELDTIFSKLEESRLRSNIPSYFVIGNHDYLGAGNQVRFDIRENLCDRGFENNPPESKKKVILRIHHHNQESSKLDNNLSYISDTVTLTINNGNNRCNDKSHFNMYYVGKLTSKNNNLSKFEILLADTSDYRDIDIISSINDNTDCEILGGWGLKGSMSYMENNVAPPQIKKLVSMSDPNVAYRLVASHYQPKNFNAFYPFNISPSKVRDALGELLSEGANYWVSGHTHTESPTIEEYKVGKTFGNSKKGKFLGINVGSTTDYNPHAIVIEKSNNQTENIDSWLGYKLIEYRNDSETCSKVFNLAESMRSDFSFVCEDANIFTTLGLNRKYRDACWNGLDVERVQHNIDLLIKKGEEKFSLSRNDVVLCLTKNATETEKKEKRR